MENQDIHVTKLTKIGNSQTIRIPKRFVDKFFPEGDVVLESTDEGLLISSRTSKISYRDAAREMSKESEDWSDWDVVRETGLDDLGEW